MSSYKERLKRIQRLADHFKVARGSYGMEYWIGEIKKAAKQPNMNIEELYADTFEKGSKPVEKTVQAKAEVIEKSETRDAAASQTLVPHSLQRIEVAAPTIQVHSPPVVVHAPSVRDLRLVDIAHRAITNAFVFGSGVMLGLLLGGTKIASLLAMRVL